MSNKVEYTGKLLNYKDYIQYSDTLCETGSAAGDGIQRALDAGFERVFSCEAQDKWFKMSYYRFVNNDKVQIIHSKSVDFLKLVVNTQSPQVIFLDAHSAGPESFGHKECVTGVPEYQQDQIIKSELEIILSKYQKHVIIIDDVNGLGDGFAEQYMDIMKAANPDYKFSFWDENLSKKPDYYYLNKLLVATP